MRRRIGLLLLPLILAGCGETREMLGLNQEYPG